MASLDKAQDKEEDEFVEALEPTTVGVPAAYSETGCFQCYTRACGRCWWITLVFCVFAWIVHSFSVAQPDPCFRAAYEAERDNKPYTCTKENQQNGERHWELAPSYTKTLLWMSIAHHTDGWKDHWERSAPPPPPDFER